MVARELMEGSPGRSRGGLRFAVVTVGVVAAAFCSGHETGLCLGIPVPNNFPVRQRPEWPRGLADVANSKGRVEGTNDNSGYVFYGQGGLSELQEVLDRFARVDMPEHEVVLLSGRRTFFRPPHFRPAYDWRLRIPGGLYLAMAPAEKETRVYIRKPTLFVCVSSKLASKLGRLRFPRGVTVLTPRDVMARCLPGLKSDSRWIRFEALRRLGELRSCGEYAVLPVTGMLADPDRGVRVAAAGVLGRYGPKSFAAVPALERYEKSDDASLARAAAGAIARIETGLVDKHWEPHVIGKTIGKLHSGAKRTMAPSVSE